MKKALIMFIAAALFSGSVSYANYLKPDEPTELRSRSIESSDQESLEKKTRSLFEKLDQEFNINQDYLLIVDGAEQKMYLLKKEDVNKDIKIHKIYETSTGKAGFGNTPHTGRTPLGMHIVKERYGDGAPIGTVFSARQETGEIAEIIYEPVNAPRNLITTRIFRLEGLEECNKTTWERNIYIHGTNEEGLIGIPSSKACIRMRNLESIKLFDSTQSETLYVFIAESLT